MKKDNIPDWNLTDFYSSIEDKNVKLDFKKLSKLIDIFVSKFKKFCQNINFNFKK